MCPRLRKQNLETAQKENLVTLPGYKNGTRAYEKWQSLEADYSKPGRQHPEIFFLSNKFIFTVYVKKGFPGLQFFILFNPFFNFFFFLGGGDMRYMRYRT